MRKRRDTTQRRVRTCTILEPEVSTGQGSPTEPVTSQSKKVVRISSSGSSGPSSLVYTCLPVDVLRRMVFTERSNSDTGPSSHHDCSGDDVQVRGAG